MTNNHPAHFAPCAPTDVHDVTLHTATPTIHVREPGGLSAKAKAALEARLREQMRASNAVNN
jgi:hypothetical protein